MKNTWQLAALLGAICFGGLSACNNIFFADQCKVDDDCRSGQVCVDNFLSNRCAVACDCDSECEEDEICSESRRARTEASAEAGAGPSATLNVCTTGCRVNADCTREGERCIDGRCSEGCNQHSQCAEGERCQSSGQCGPIECESKDDCAPGQVCVNRCIEGCLSDDDCEGGEGCIRTDQNPGYCTPSACIGDEDCEGNLRCLCGSCVTHCESDDECGGTAECARAVHECTPNQCKQSGHSVSCGGTSCPSLPADELLGTLLEPCCLGGDPDAGCGFRQLSFFGPAGPCGERIEAGATCDCDEEECCLSDGSCGRLIKPIAAEVGVFDLCAPKSPAEDPSCTPS